MKGLFIPGITVEMFRNGCLEAIEQLMAEGEIYDIDYDPELKKDDWIPFTYRTPTEEEKENHPDWNYVLDGKLPEDGQRILVNIKYKAHEAVQLDEFYYDGEGCYLDNGYDIGTEATAWMPLPELYRGEQE